MSSEGGIPSPFAWIAKHACLVPLPAILICLLSSLAFFQKGRSGKLDRGIHPILPGRFFPRRPTDTDCRSPGMRRRRKEGRSIQHPLISQLDMPTRSGRRWRGRHFQLGQKNGNHRTSHSPSSVRPQTPPRRSRPQTKDGSQSISTASKIVGRTDRGRRRAGKFFPRHVMRPKFLFNGSSIFPSFEQRMKIFASNFPDFFRQAARPCRGSFASSCMDGVLHLLKEIIFVLLGQMSRSPLRFDRIFIFYIGELKNSMLSHLTS